MAGGLLVIPGDGSVVAIQNPTNADEYWMIPGVSSWTEGGGDTPQRDVVGFEGVSAQQGRTRAQTVECEVSAYAPLHRAWKEARAAQIANTKRNFILFTPRQEFEPWAMGTAARHLLVPEHAAGVPAMLTIKADDLDLTSSNFAPGMCFVLAANAADAMLPETENLYVIERVTDTKTALCSRVSGTKRAVADVIEAADTQGFAIVEPQLQRGPASCSVGGVDRASTRAEGDLSAGMTLTPSGILPAYSVSTVDLGMVKSQ